MKHFALTTIIFFFTISGLQAQISADSVQREQKRLLEISKFQSIDYFSKAKEQKRPALKGDLVVLQDEERKLYFGIIDTMRSLNSIRVILYPEPNRRELVEATYDDLHYLRSSPIVLKKAAPVPDPADAGPDYAVEIAKRDNLIKMQDVRMNQAADYLESAGKAYELSEIMKFVGYGSIFAAGLFSAVGGLNNNVSAQATALVFYGISAGSGIASIVYRFKGNSNLKTAGAVLRR